MLSFVVRDAAWSPHVRDAGADKFCPRSVDGTLHDVQAEVYEWVEGGTFETCKLTCHDKVVRCTSRYFQPGTR